MVLSGTPCERQAATSPTKRTFDRALDGVRSETSPPRASGGRWEGLRKRCSLPPTSPGTAKDDTSSATEGMPTTPEPRTPVAAPTTPPRRAQEPARNSSRFGAIVSPFAFKTLAGTQRFTLEFDNVESFKLWLATGTSRSYLRSRTSAKASPGWGIIDQLQIAEPKFYQDTCIGSVRWVHWGDGSVRVNTMTDSNPTDCQAADRASEQDACHQAQIRKDHLRARLHIVLALSNLSVIHSLPKDSCGLVLAYLFPKALCLAPWCKPSS